MFRSNFVVSVKSNGKFHRENGETIQIPFGSEYSIFLKNLDARRATAKISIDGNDVLDGKKIIVEGQSSIELDGYMTGTEAKNAFKFIKRTKQIEDYRGITPEDGLIVVEFDRENERPVYVKTVYLPYYVPNWYPPYAITTTFGSTSGNTSCWSISSSNNVESRLNENLSTPFDDGITVKGSDISQQFNYGYVGEMENRPTIISLKLIGFDSTEEKPIFTSDKVTCSTCGMKSKNIHKFCPNCGTRLGV